MNERQAQELHGIRLARRVLDHSPEAREVNASPLRAEFDQLILSIEKHALAQDAYGEVAQSQTKQLKSLRHDLYFGHLHPIVAFVHAKKSKVPAIQDITLPTQSVPHQEIADFARVLANLAKEHRDVFLAHHFRGDFVEQLVAKAGEFQELLISRGGSRQQVSQATLGIPYDLREARRVVKALGALIADRCGPRSPLLKEWRKVSIHAARRLPKGATAKRLRASPDDAHAKPVVLASGVAPDVRQLPAGPSEKRRGVLGMVAKLLGSGSAAELPASQPRRALSPPRSGSGGA